MYVVVCRDSLTATDYVSASASYMVEELGEVRGLDQMVVVARLQYQYPVHDWKRVQAERLHGFLLSRRRFTREELKRWIYRERFLLYRGVRETAFVRKLLSIVLDELQFRGYVEFRDGFYVVVEKPSLEECLRVLSMQVYDVYR